jgi:hypothetical protein
MAHDLNDYEPGEVLAKAQRIAERAVDRTQAEAVAGAIALLRETCAAEHLPPHIARALSVVLSTRPSAWLEYAVEQRLLEEDSKY